MKKELKDAELILNPDGSIYHLSLLPGDIGDLIITVGDPDRVSMVSKYFDKIELKKQHREFITHTGYVGAKKLSVISSGIGTDNIDIVLNELDALANIDFKTREIKATLQQLQIVRLGTSGSLYSKIPEDSIVASSAGLGLDNLMHYYKLNQENLPDVNIELPIQPYYFEAAPALLDLFSDQKQGITATCAGFYGPQGRSLRLDIYNEKLLDQLRQTKINNKQVVNFEMETAGIYGLAKLLGHEALSLNAILANRETGAFSKNPKAAVDHLIQFALDRLC